MKELTIRHLPVSDEAAAMVRVGYRARPDQSFQEESSPFSFAITPDQHAQVQWYLEEYLQYPWGELRTRAQAAEDLLGWSSGWGSILRATYPGGIATWYEWQHGNGNWMCVGVNFVALWGTYVIGLNVFHYAP